MNEQELCKKRLIDLSRQADQKGIVLFSDFLNLNEQDIYHTSIRELYTNTEIYGGYHNSERQMVAFIPDALCYEWSYPIVCLKVVPQYPKFSEKLTHRDILGALMNLGIDRSRIGDIVCQNETYYIFCMDNIHTFIVENLTRIKHTSVNISAVDQTQEIQVVLLQKLTICLGLKLRNTFLLKKYLLMGNVLPTAIKPAIADLLYPFAEKGDLFLKRIIL